METAPKVKTVGYQIVLCIHCNQIARKPVRGPERLSDPTEHTALFYRQTSLASSAATRAVGIRKTIAAKR